MKRAAGAPEHPEDDERGDDGEGDEAEADGVGRQVLASSEKAAPVLSTWVMRKTRGMTVMAEPGRMWWMIQFLERRSSRMTRAERSRSAGRRSGPVRVCWFASVDGFWQV